MQKHQSIDQLLISLEKLKDKESFLKEVADEFDEVRKYLSDKGLAINIFKGLEYKQPITNEVDNYQYFRDLHFIFWGVMKNHWECDNKELEYYNQLRLKVESLISSFTN